MALKRELNLPYSVAAPRACQKPELGAGFSLAPRTSPNIGKEARLARDLAAVRRMRDGQN